MSALLQQQRMHAPWSQTSTETVNIYAHAI